MSSECRPRDCYDLCTRRIIKGWRVDVEESQDVVEARTKENERSSSLVKISKTLRGVLKKNDALVSGINLGTHRLQQAADNTTSPPLPERPLAPGPSRPNTDFDDAVNRSRLDSASYLAEVLVDSLKQINQAILRSSINSARPSQKPTVQESAVFYRVSRETSYTSHDVNLGFWSARGLPDHDFRGPFDYEFRAHVDGQQNLGGSELRAHMDGEQNLTKPYEKRGQFKSPYISLTSDPGFACEYGAYDGRLVYEIDAAKLRLMKVHIESTPDIARGWRIRFTGPDDGRQRYVTDTHWLARFWIPAECMRAHSFTEFRAKCVKAGFVDGSTYKAIKRGLPADAHEKLASFLRPMIIDQEFAVNSDDEPTPNVTPPKPVTPKPKSADDHDKPKEQPSPTSPTKAEVVFPRRRVLRKVPRRKLADGSRGNVAETPTPVQNPPAAESELEQSLHDLSVSKEQPSPTSPTNIEDCDEIWRGA